MGPAGSLAAYLVHDILKGIWAVNGKADEEKVGFRVRKWAETIIFFLSGCIPESELDSLAGWWVGCVRDIILKHSRNIFLLPHEQVIKREWKRRGCLSYLWEVALAVANEKTGLPTATVAHNDKLL